MSQIPPTSKDDRSKFEPQPQRTSEERQRRLKEEEKEIEIAALQVFFSIMDENSGGEETDEKGKIKKIVNEVVHGKMSPIEAAAEILTIVTDAKKGILGKHQALHLGTHARLNESQEKLLANLHLFSLFLSEKTIQKASFKPYLNQAISFSDRFENGSISTSEAFQGLSSLISEINGALPPSQRYPNGLRLEMFE